MKILYLVTAYPRHSDDIITPWLVELIHRLGTRGIEIEVLAPSYRGLGSQRVDGIRVHRFRYAPRVWETLTHDQTAPDRIRERPIYLGLVPGYVLAGAVAAARLARPGRFDLVHAFWPLPHGLIGLAAKRAAGLPLVCTFFGVELTWMESQLPFLRPVLERIIRGSDAVTTISSYTAAKLESLVPGTRMARIPFGATVDPASSPPRPETPSEGPFELLFVGRLVERKGVRLLLDAIREVDPAHPLLLRVVGDGPERAELESRAARLGIAGRVRFEGFVSTGELAERFASCDAFVLPATVDAKGDTEGLGVVLLEALSYGKPVIASAAGGIMDIVRDGETGILVPPGDVPALRDAILSLMSAPEQRRALGAAGRAHVGREFSWPVIVERLEEVYRSLVPSQGSPAETTGALTALRRRGR